jgi:hypothetical protein
MSGGNDNYQELIEINRFMGVVEQGVRTANREIFHKHIDSVNHETVLTLGVSVANFAHGILKQPLKPPWKTIVQP